MNITELKLGTAILVDVERGGSLFTLKSKVFDSDANGIFILPPYDKEGEIKDLQHRDEISIRLPQKKKILKWVCDIFETRYVKETKYVYITSATVAENGEMRNAFRLNIFKPITVLNEDTKEEHLCVLRDVSISGVGLQLTTEFEIGSVFTLTIEDLDLSVPLKVRVVRKVKEGSTFILGCGVIKSDNNLRKYVTEKQREEIRKLRGIDYTRKSK